MEEIWKDIEGYENLYQVSNKGRFKSFKKSKDGDLLNPFYDKYGYLNISICRKKQKAHRVVAKAFISNPENKPTVNHINGVHDDNRVENLEWATMKEQIEHSFRTGLTKKRYGTDNKFSKEVYQYDTNLKLIEKHVSAAEAQRRFGFIKFHIYACCNGKRKTTGGYIWSREKKT